MIYVLKLDKILNGIVGNAVSIASSWYITIYIVIYIYILYMYINISKCFDYICICYKYSIIHMY